MTALLAHYSGRVQGVGFRATAADLAREHPAVAGYVRNLPDGRVELFAQADAFADARALLDAVAARFARQIRDWSAAPAVPIDRLAGFTVRP